ncbi:MAG: hypothetical protein WCI67_08635, partial [Chloroflexales bacterium]
MATGPTNVAVSVAPAPRDLPLEQTDRRVALRAYALFGWLIPLALCHGLLYMLIVPPWQHYDEPPHFEYAWLIADRGRTPTLDEIDPQLRRAVAESMDRARFYPPGQH